MSVNEKLIEEARRSALAMDYERAYQGGLVGRLADALEAAEKALGEATVTLTDEVPSPQEGQVKR